MRVGSIALSETPIDTHRSDEENLVWRIASRRLEQAASRSSWHPGPYLQHLHRFVQHHVTAPSLEEINEWLAPTGWRACMADGYISVDQYGDLLSRRVFPIARQIRALRDLEHSAAPDFIHDVLGHLPMLFDSELRELMSAWAECVRTSTSAPQDQAVAVALDNLISARGRQDRDLLEIDRLTMILKAAHEDAVRMCSRRFLFETFFTWVFEFGLFKERDGRFRLAGGACLSSIGETSRLMRGGVVLSPFSEGAIGHPVDYTVYQSVMFYFTSYDELTRSLYEI